MRVNGLSLDGFFAAIDQHHFRWHEVREFFPQSWQVEKDCPTFLKVDSTIDLCSSAGVRPDVALVIKEAGDGSAYRRECLVEKFGRKIGALFYKHFPNPPRGEISEEKSEAHSRNLSRSIKLAWKRRKRQEAEWERQERERVIEQQKEPSWMLLVPSVIKKQIDDSL